LLCVSDSERESARLACTNARVYAYVRVRFCACVCMSSPLLLVKE